MERDRFGRQVIPPTTGVRRVRRKGSKSGSLFSQKILDLSPLLGLNAGSLLRIPRAWLLSGAERLGSLNKRKGYWKGRHGRAFVKTEWILSKTSPHSSL
jgi:hypothetical protein